MIFLDSWVFLEYLGKAEKSDKCKELILGQEEKVISTIVIVELRYHGIKKFGLENTENIISLIEDEDRLEGDPELISVAKKALISIRFVMEATYPNATNIATADELATVLNQTYQSPLYQKGEGFRGKIFYKEHENYVSRK